MSRPDDSHDIGALRERLVAARKHLAALPVSKQHHPGPTDPATGEAWHHGNVLGHVSEMLPYWTDQLRSAKAGSGRVGRDESGAKRRRKGIDEGDAAAEARLRREIDEGIGGVLALMNELSAEDLERTVVYVSREGEREARIGELLQFLVVVHVEDHLDQLANLVGPT